MKHSFEEISRRYEQQKQENRDRNLSHAMRGVIFQDIDLAFTGEGAVIAEGVFIGACVTIEGDVQIGMGTRLGACVTIRGGTRIGSDCKIGQNTLIQDSTIEDGCAIGQNTLIQDSTIEDGCTIDQNSRLIEAVIREGAGVLESVVLESEVGKNAAVGPFAYIRPGSHIGENVRIGDFVEIKNSNIGNNTKISHLTYVGDADLGEDINLGCGVVFVNYDGVRKYRSRVEDHAFIGCNVNLISPVTVEEGAYIAAGTTVTKSVPAGSLSVGRAKERIIENWTERRGSLKGR